MRQYKPRRIDFKSTESVNGWRVKLYTITHNASFQSDDILEKALKKLPEWLEESKSMGFPVHGMAFLIVHEASDGAWSLLSWWTGGEMLRTITWFTDFEKRDEFRLLPQSGSMACVWELAVTAHERKAWITHILKEAESPKFSDYLNDVINETL